MNNVICNKMLYSEFPQQRVAYSLIGDAEFATVCTTLCASPVDDEEEEEEEEEEKEEEEEEKEEEKKKKKKEKKENETDRKKENRKVGHNDPSKGRDFKFTSKLHQSPFANKVAEYELLVKHSTLFWSVCMYYVSSKLVLYIL
ncbi:Protein of unknown function, partial [Gryllus bimaculatus]